MKRKLISSGSVFEEKIGYSRAVVQGSWIFVSGTTGYNYETMTISDDIVEQVEQCFINIKDTLEKVDANLSDIVRVTYILTDANAFKKCWPILQKYLGTIKPAATMFSAGLADDNMKIEIQVTALKS
ncbi:MAG: RidA family protein [Algibacter sp.]|uniref:RidA family protein n=1 Tax=Algibacter sp. TaxID=1872428 RepID=UPI00260702E4|nr:RidA family protein [Algibacter sp.]MDG1728337.1 RidA family protein [Algibacter sp.]MDG2178382.1 RidA family protein [Algibacter sp.]